MHRKEKDAPYFGGKVISFSILSSIASSETFNIRVCNVQETIFFVFRFLIDLIHCLICIKNTKGLDKLREVNSLK